MSVRKRVIANIVTTDQKICDREIVVLLVFITGVGTFLRFWALDFQSLWHDELLTWGTSSFQSLRQVLELGVVPDVHPPGYFFFMHGIINLFGDSALALRAPSAILGCLAIIAVFFLGRELFSYKEGLWAAALIAVARTPIFYS